MKVYVDGKILEGEKAVFALHPGPQDLPLQEGLLGAALAEAMRVAGGKVPLLNEHLARLDEGCRVLGWKSPQGSVRLAVTRVLKANRLEEGSLRLRFFGQFKAKPRLIVLAFPASGFNPSRKKSGLRLFTSSIRHYGSHSLQGRLKANSMLPNVLSQWEAQAWVEDGLRLTARGLVAEGSWNNILCSKRGLLRTPPLSLGILEGTTRRAFIADWQRKGGTVREMPLTRQDLYVSDKVWVCSAIKGPLPVAEVDGRKIGPAPVL
jgi:branched-chain amino acid aminotransferase